MTNSSSLQWSGWERSCWATCGGRSDDERQKQEARRLVREALGLDGGAE